MPCLRPRVVWRSSPFRLLSEFESAATIQLEALKFEWRRVSQIHSGRSVTVAAVTELQYSCNLNSGVSLWPLASSPLESKLRPESDACAGQHDGVMTRRIRFGREVSPPTRSADSKASVARTAKS